MSFQQVLKSLQIISCNEPDFKEIDKFVATY